MNDAPEPDLPANLRFLRVLVTVLTATMILGLITIVALLVIRFSQPPRLSLPDEIALPDLPGMRERAPDGVFVPTEWEHLGFFEDRPIEPLRVAAWWTAAMVRAFIVAFGCRMVVISLGSALPNIGRMVGPVGSTVSMPLSYPMPRSGPKHCATGLLTLQSCRIPANLPATAICYFTPRIPMLHWLRATVWEYQPELGHDLVWTTDDWPNAGGSPR